MRRAVMAAIDRVADAFLAVDAEDARIVDANPAAGSLLGVARDALLGVDALSFVPDAARDGWWVELDAVSEGAEPRRFATRVRDASGRDVAIAGSISCLPPKFDVHAYPSEHAERAAYLELAETLAELGVDLLLLEMMQETRHAPLACAAAKSVGLPVWLGVSCRIGAGGALVGFDFPLVPLEATLDALLGFEPDAVAVMHNPAGAVTPALALVRSRFAGLLGAYPELGDGTSASTATPAELAELARAWIGDGARIVGGCCGTTPEHIRALAALVHGNGIGPTSFGT